MTEKTKLTEDLKQLKHLEAKDEELFQKLGEFMLLLDQSKLDSRNIQAIQETINIAIDRKVKSEDVIKEIKQISLGNLDKLDQLDQLEFLLTTQHIDSKQVKKVVFKNFILKFIKIIIGFLLLTLGFAMIILPAPPYFEMFTIFYFNPNDGVTLMDVISLIVIAVGIYIIVKSFFNFKPNE